MNSELRPAFAQIVNMLRDLGTDASCLPATYLYNEGWMLRLILSAAADGLMNKMIPRIAPARWTSEAKLYTPFDRARGEAYEGLTTADGVVGDIDWEPGTQTGVKLKERPERFEVFEAKLFSKLSARVTAADWYDQAVRSVACMAHTMALANKKPSETTWTRLRFWVVAPQTQIDRGIFSTELTLGSMRAKIKMRIAQFSGQANEELELWNEEFFDPLLQQFDPLLQQFDPLLQQFDAKNGIYCVSWEQLIKSISDVGRREAIDQFYKQCLEVGSREKAGNDADSPVRGWRYQIEGQSPSKVVVVCNVGKNTSRVFVQRGDDASFTIDNRRLKPVGDDQPPVPLIVPPIGALRLYQGRPVRVISNGPCRSKVENAESPGPTQLVDNHLLLEEPIGTEDEVPT